MTQNPNSLKNLKPYTKKDGDNPAPGQKPGTIHVNKRLQKIVESMGYADDIKNLPEDLREKLQQRYGRRPLADMLVANMLGNALLKKNSERAIETLMNRLYGMPNQKVDVTDNTLIRSAKDFKGMTDEQAAEAYKRVARDSTALAGGVVDDDGKE